MRQTRLTPATLLVIDDGADNLEELSHTLQQPEWTVLIRPPSEQVLQQAEAIQPDLIVLNVGRTGCDQTELCRRLKLTPSLCEAPVMIVVNADDLANRRYGFAAGAADYLIQPFQSEEILARVSAQLKLQSLTQQANRQNAALQQEVAARKQSEFALQQANQQLAQAIRDRQKLETAFFESERRNPSLIDGHSEDLFRQVTDNRREVFWMTTLLTSDPNQRDILYVSPAYEAVWGRDPEDLYRNPGLWSESVHAEDRELAEREFLDQVLQGKFDHEYRIVRPDGSMRWIRDRGFPVQTSEERCRVIGIAEDITERKQAEESVRQMRNFLQTVIDQLPVAVFVKDGRAEYFSQHLLWNKASEQLFGITADEAIGKTAHDLFPRDQADFFIQRDRKTFEQGVPEDIPQEYADSQTLGRRILHTVKTPLYDENQEPQYLVCFSEDITERKLIEQQIQQHQTFLYNVIDAVPNLIFVKDWDGRYLLANQAAARFYNTPVEALIGKTDADFHPFPEDVEKFVQENRTVIQSGQPLFIPEEQVSISPDMGEWLQWQKRPLQVPGIDTVCVLGVGVNITARKQTEAQLRDLSSRLELAVKSAQIGIWDWDIVNDYLIWDDRMYELYGVNPTDFTGTYQTWRLCVHPEDLADFQAAFQQALSGERDFDAEFRIVEPDGDIRFIEAHALIWRDPQRLPQRMIGVNIDITERKQAEAALRDNETRFRQLAENIHEVFYLSNLTGPEILYVSPAYETIWGLTRQSLYEHPESFLEAIHPDDQQRVMDSLSRQQQGEETRAEYRVVQPDGSIRWVYDRSFPVLDESGRLYRTCGVAEDITDRRQTEESIRQLGIAVDNAMTGISRLDPEGRFTMVREGYAQMLGYRPEEMIGLSWEKTAPEADHEIALAAVQKMLTAGRAELELRALRKDGSIFYEHLLLVKAFNDRGEHDGHYCFMRDISDRKQAELERERLLADAIAARVEATQARDLLTNVFERMNDGIVALDRDWRYTYVNENAGELLGRSAADLIGKHIWTEFPEGVGQPFYHNYYQAVEQQTAIYMEEYYEPWNRWFENRIYPSGDGLTIYFTEITDRKRAEQALRQSEETLRLFFDLPFIGMAILSPETHRWVRFNDRLCEILGYPRTELQPLTWFQIIHADDLYQDEAEFEQMVQGRSDGYIVDKRLIRKDGQVINATINLKCIYTSDQAIDFFVVTVQDITERKQTEAQLRFQAQLLDSVRESIIATDLEGYITYWSKGATALYGYAEEEVMGQLLSPFILERNQFEAEAARERQVIERGSWQGENIQKRKDGFPFWAETTIFLANDQEGRPFGFIGIDRDISDRKQAAQAIQRLNEQLEQQNRDLEALVAKRTGELQAFFEALPDYVYMHEGPDLRIALCNDRQAQFLGFENRFQVEGKTLFDCFSADQAAIFVRQNRQILESGESLRTQEVWELSTGQCHFDTIKTPLKRSNGEIYGLVGVTRDITELVHTRQALAERTVQLEAINKELESFSYSVSHDLRAPLRHMHGFVNALRSRLEQDGAITNPKVTHYLNIIDDSSHKMGQLIDGLLTLSRIGRKQMTYESVNVQRLVYEAISLVIDDPTPTTLAEFSIGDLPTVRGDAALLQQVFTNLIGNAVKFSRPVALPQITIGSSSDGTIFVKDNGVGFEMAYVDQLFSAFQRLHSKRDFEGTGIGLAIVQRIIHRHGGRIWAEGEPGQGAAFYFTLDPPLNGERDAIKGTP